MNTTTPAALISVALLALTQVAVAQPYEPPPIMPQEVEPGGAMLDPPPPPGRVFSLGACPGVTGWSGHQCHGMSYRGFFSQSYACDALCTWDGSDIITGDADGQDAIPASRADIRSIELDDAGRLRIETRDRHGGCSDAADTVVQVHQLGPNGWVQLGPDYDDVAARPGDPFGRCESVEVSVPAGQYVVRIDGYGDQMVRKYQWRISAIVEARGPGSYAGEVPWMGDDLFEVTLSAPGRICTGDGQGSCPGDTEMFFVNPPPGYQPRDDDSGVDRCSCLDAPAGIHLVRVAGYDKQAVPPYVLMVP